MNLLMKSSLLALIMSFTSFVAFSQELPTLRFPLSVSLEVLDPTEAEDFVTIRVLMNLGSGLMRSDKNLKPLNELCESYKVSHDQKTYTFTLKNIKWSDQTPLVADDFIYAFKRTLSPQTKAKISQTFQEIVVNAKDYKNSKISDFSKVGIKAINTKTIEFKLNHPSSSFLSLLTLPFTFPMKVGHEKIKPHSPSVGRYVLDEFKTAQKIVLLPNTNHFSPAKNKVEIKFIQESSTLVSLYEKNEIDVIEKLPSADYERFKKDSSLITGPFLATYYLGFNIHKKPFDDVKVRKLIISSINREEINKVLRDPQHIASSLVPTPLAGSHKKYEITKSSQVEYKNLNFELVYDAQEKNNLIAALIQNQIKKNLHYQMPVKSYEWKSFINLLSNEKPAFFRFAWLAAFPDPLSHLNVFKGDNPNNYTGYNNAEYNALVDQIAKTPQSKIRDILIDKAQNKLLIEDAVIMPLFHYKQYMLIKNFKGLETTPMGLLYFDQAHQ